MLALQKQPADLMDHSWLATSSSMILPTLLIEETLAAPYHSMIFYILLGHSVQRHTWLSESLSHPVLTLRVTLREVAGKKGRVGHGIEISMVAPIACSWRCFCELFEGLPKAFFRRGVGSSAGEAGVDGRVGREKDGTRTLLDRGCPWYNRFVGFRKSIPHRSSEAD
jgi:hypothetical protein